VPFEEMVARAGDLRPDELADGRAAPGAGRFDHYARRLWDGLLAGERLEER
jgi:hypothetical protein